MYMEHVELEFKHNLELELNEGPSKGQHFMI